MPLSLKRLRFKQLQHHYRHHAYEKRFDWDWDSLHYNRIAVVNLLAAKFPACDYLEIGCAANSLFDAVCAPNKVGVDPMRGGTLRQTSDAFFAENTKKFDVIFIDGLHEYHQVRKDVENAMRALKPGGWIALHDMMPAGWMEQHVPMLKSDVWNGDVWKVAFELSQSPGIDFKIIKVDHGVGVFRLDDPHATLIDREQELSAKQFAFYYENFSSLPVVEWHACQAWLRR